MPVVGVARRRAHAHHEAFLEREVTQLVCLRLYLCFELTYRFDLSFSSLNIVKAAGLFFRGETARTLNGACLTSSPSRGGYRSGYGVLPALRQLQGELLRRHSLRRDCINLVER